MRTQSVRAPKVSEELSMRRPINLADHYTPNHIQRRRSVKWGAGDD